MRANDDIDGPLVDLLDRGVDFLGRLEARQLGDAHRPVGEAVREGLRVLLGEQGGRREQRDLLATHHGDEGRAQRDFGLAETDVAADETIHRLAARHIADHGGNRGGLVGRFLEAEAFRKFHVVARLERERMAFARRTARVQVEQFGGGIANLLGSAALGLFPLTGAERVKRGAFRIGAAIARNYVQLRDRHIEFAFAGVFEVQELGFTFAEIHRHQTHIAADAVLRMHDRVAHLQLGQVAHHRIDVARLFLAAPSRAAHERAVQLGFRDDSDAVGRHRKADGKRCNAKREAFVADQPVVEAIARRGSQMIVSQQLQQRLAPARRFRGKQHAVLGRLEIAAQCRDRIVCMAIDREIR